MPPTGLRPRPNPAGKLKTTDIVGLTIGGQTPWCGREVGERAVAAIHFTSGLPRSGSTLLAALLRQTPGFAAGMSGPLAGLFGALLVR